MLGLNKLSAASVTPGTRLIDAVKAIEVGGIQAVLVVDKDGRFSGMATDGDVRRGILKGVSLESPVDLVMSQKPAVIDPSGTSAEARALMAKLLIRQLPVVNNDGRIVGLHHIDFADEAEESNCAVIMAGGQGSRLHPITRTIPKPMLSVGGQPLLETIVRNLVSQNFSRIYISVNYMADVIKTHFGDGSRFGADIQYLEETTRLGTAGALGLLPTEPKGPFLVINGDILTSVNFRSLLNFHKENEGVCTVCVRDYNVQIPYGVVDVSGGRVNEISEKPTMRYFVSAGIYVVDPLVLGQVKADEYLDMPQLVKDSIARGMKVASFPIHEYWLDIGRIDDLQRARDDFDEVFRS